MRKSNPQSAFPVLLIAVFIMVFGGGLFAAIGNLIITELTSTNISSLHSVSSGVYVTPDPTLENCDWRYGMPHKMHWPQLPDFGEFGIDVELTVATLADDFKCTATGPINDIHFWASFASDILPKNGPDSLTFEISIHSDIPAIGNMWSMPGDVLWSKTFVPGEYTVRKITNRPSDWYDPLSQVSLNNNHRLAYQYNFCIDKDPFTQEEGTIYWLSIREIRPSDATHKLGWKTTTKKLRWNDSAVYTVSGAALSLPIYYPKAHEYDGESLNLAFSITDGDQGDRLHDLGDAPDSSNTFPGETMLAYPLTNTVANYPTIFWTSFPPYGPIHWQPAQWFYLGNDVTFESGADYGYDEDINNNLYPPGDLSNRDGADDGLELPLILPHCEQASIPFKVTFVNPTVGAAVYLNLWCDWNRDGDWDDTLDCPRGPAPEWAVQNQMLINLPAGLNQITTPGFLAWHPEGGTEDIWMRITLSGQPYRGGSNPGVKGNAGSGPQAKYTIGETEDYHFTPEVGLSVCEDFNGDGVIDMNDLTAFAYEWLENCQ